MGGESSDTVPIHPARGSTSVMSVEVGLRGCRSCGAEGQDGAGGGEGEEGGADCRASGRTCGAASHIGDSRSSVAVVAPRYVSLYPTSLTICLPTYL